MKAQFIFENYPLGTANDPNAPWNESEDKSFTEFEIKGSDFRLITKAYVGEDDIEILENQEMDPMDLDKALLSKLGLSYEELEAMNMEEEFYIEDYNQKNNIVYFKTTAGDTELSISELQFLAGIRHRKYSARIKAENSQISST
jgi:hypothetical protein